MGTLTMEASKTCPFRAKAMVLYISYPMDQTNPLADLVPFNSLRKNQKFLELGIFVPSVCLKKRINDNL